jgi:hypothetical protein
MIGVMRIGLIKKVWGASCRWSHFAATAASRSVCRSGTLWPARVIRAGPGRGRFAESTQRGLPEQVNHYHTPRSLRCTRVLQLLGVKPGSSGAPRSRSTRWRPRKRWGSGVELRGFEPLTPSMRNPRRPASSTWIGHFVPLLGRRRPLPSAAVAVLSCCTPARRPTRRISCLRPR